jgi:hypothetical protein
MIKAPRIEFRVRNRYPIRLQPCFRLSQGPGPGPSGILYGFADKNRSELQSAAD